MDAKGNVENYETLLQAIQYAAGIPFYFEKIKGRSDGYYHHVSKDIHIQEGMNPSMTISTCLHEITHARLHDHDAVPKDQRKDRNTREVEAESVAFIVCEHFGVDTIAPSASYIAGWSKQKEPMELLESIDVIGDTSSDLIEQVENRYLELLKEKERGQKTEPERSSVEGRLLQLSQRTSNDRPDQEWSGREDQSQER